MSESGENLTQNPIVKYDQTMQQIRWQIESVEKTSEHNEKLFEKNQKLAELGQEEEEEEEEDEIEEFPEIPPGYPMDKWHKKYGSDTSNPQFIEKDEKEDENA